MYINLNSQFRTLGTKEPLIGSDLRTISTQYESGLIKLRYEYRTPNEKRNKKSPKSMGSK